MIQVINCKVKVEIRKSDMVDSLSWFKKVRQSRPINYGRIYSNPANKGKVDNNPVNKDKILATKTRQSSHLVN